MSRFPKLSTFAKSAAVALVLGGATLGAAMPAQAAPPQIDFHFGFGGGGVSIGGGQYCLSDRQVGRLLQWQGYENIRFTDRRGRIVSARAEKYHRAYIVSVDSCRARIVYVQRLHPRPWDPRPWDHRGRW